ncbi:WecB/TagA/CpsF family glycosyltransferase [Arthrobacter sp. Sr33]
MKKSGPLQVDRLIVHQFDPAKPSPGGIDTCLRGICAYAPADQELAVVGVDTGGGGSGRVLGAWEVHTFNGRSVWFLPVARLDPGDQRRRVPHSLRLIGGLMRFRSRLPAADLVQAHRMDTALAVSRLVAAPLVYFIHTQENGLTGATSDSIWRRAAGVHRRLEESVVTRAVDVVVFNEDYAQTVVQWNQAARFSPTWYDPKLIRGRGNGSATGRSLCWVGRLETPKDPLLALDVMESLADGYPGDHWSLELLGSGTLLDAVTSRAETLSTRSNLTISVRGRVNPPEVAAAMERSDIFLMTSHPGYEGYPRVLVEAMASGLAAVVTDGSDTGSLVVDGVTGYVTPRDPQQIAVAVDKVKDIQPAAVIKAVEALSAPAVVRNLLSFSGPRPVAIGQGSARGRNRKLRDTARQEIALELDGEGVRLGRWRLFNGDTVQLLTEIGSLVDSKQPHLVVTPNVDQVLDLQESPALRRAYDAASLRLVDGAPLVAVLRLLGARDIHRHTGADLLPLMAEHSADTGWRIAILGGNGDVGRRAAATLMDSYPGSVVHSIPFPYVKDVSETASSNAVDALAAWKPAVVFICLGSPKQEAFFSHWRADLPPAVYIGAGAAADFAAGSKRRAPAAVQNLGLEWTWRLIQEPRRLAGRYLVKGPRFIRPAISSLTRRFA